MDPPPKRLRLDATGSAQPARAAHAGPITPRIQLARHRDAQHVRTAGRENESYRGTTGDRGSGPRHSKSHGNKRLSRTSLLAPLRSNVGSSRTMSTRDISVIDEEPLDLIPSIVESQTYDEQFDEDEDEELAGWYGRPTPSRPQAPFNRRSTKDANMDTQSPGIHVYNPRLKYPSEENIMAQFGPELGPKIARYVARASEKEAEKQLVGRNLSSSQAPSSSTRGSMKTVSSHLNELRRSPTKGFIPIPPPSKSRAREEFQLLATPMHSRHSRRYNRLEFTPSEHATSVQFSREQPDIASQGATRAPCVGQSPSRTIGKLLTEYPLSDFEDDDQNKQSGKSQASRRDSSIPGVPIPVTVPQQLRSDDENDPTYEPTHEDTWEDYDDEGNASDSDSSVDDRMPSLSEELAQIQSTLEHQDQRTPTDQIKDESASGASYTTFINSAQLLPNGGTLDPSNSGSPQELAISAVDSPLDSTFIFQQPVVPSEIHVLSHKRPRGRPRGSGRRVEPSEKRPRGRPRKYPRHKRDSTKVFDITQRSSWTRQDEEILWKWMQMCERVGIPFWNRHHWKELSKRYPQHSSASWRNRFRDTFPITWVMREGGPTNPDQQVTPRPVTDMVDWLEEDFNQTADETIQFGEGDKQSREETNSDLAPAESPSLQDVRTDKPQSLSDTNESRELRTIHSLPFTETSTQAPNASRPVFQAASPLSDTSTTQREQSSEAVSATEHLLGDQSASLSNGQQPANMKARCPLGACASKTENWYLVKALPGKALSEFARHMGLEHSSIPFPCRAPDCDCIGSKGFTRASELAAHVRTSHCAAEYQNLKATIDQETWEQWADVLASNPATDMDKADGLDEEYYGRSYSLATPRTALSSREQSREVSEAMVEGDGSSIPAQNVHNTTQMMDPVLEQYLYESADQASDAEPDLPQTHDPLLSLIDPQILGDTAPVAVQTRAALSKKTPPNPYDFSDEEDESPPRPPPRSAVSVSKQAESAVAPRLLGILSVPVREYKSPYGSVPPQAV